METDTLVALITTISAAVNVMVLGYQSWRKLKPEVKKMEAEGDSEIVESSNKSLQGASISQDMLKERIDELKQEIEGLKKLRREDADYFRRRIKEIDKEARDYRLWAARLAKQVIEAGKVPVPFISSSGESDPLITAIDKERDELSKTKDAREQEISNASKPTEEKK